MIVATGGLPNVGHFEGTEHVTTVWDVLGGHTEPDGRVLVYDDNGSHQSPLMRGTPREPWRPSHDSDT